jgi:hypothetical protein
MTSAIVSLVVGIATPFIKGWLRDKSKSDIALENLRKTLNGAFSKENHSVKQNERTSEAKDKRSKHFGDKK